MKLLALLSLTYLLALPTSFACMCKGRTIEEELKTAHLVFTGVCISVTHHDDTGLNECVFQVESAWVNRPAQRVTVFTPGGGSDCDIPFTPTKRYAVWARLQQPEPGSKQSNPRLRTANCDRTGPIEFPQVKSDLAALGAPLVQYPARK